MDISTCAGATVSIVTPRRFRTYALSHTCIRASTPGQCSLVSRPAPCHAPQWTFSPVELQLRSKYVVMRPQPGRQQDICFLIALMCKTYFDRRIWFYRRFGLSHFTITWRYNVGFQPFLSIVGLLITNI